MLEYVSAANKLGIKGVLFRNAEKLGKQLKKMGLLPESKRSR